VISLNIELTCGRYILKLIVLFHLGGISVIATNIKLAINRIARNTIIFKKLKKRAQNEPFLIMLEQLIKNKA
jgi:hypothetical protein